jgi:hypothetical protein
MARPLNYDEIIDNLAQKTEQGKLSWSPTSQDDAFVCVLEGEFTFRVVKFEYRNEERVAFSMTDKTNSEIFQLAASFGEAFYQKLNNLHEVARRAALDVEVKLNQVSDILKRI